MAIVKNKERAESKDAIVFANCAGGVLQYLSARLWQCWDKL
jgi:hypothetical protein